MPSHILRIQKRLAANLTHMRAVLVDLLVFATVACVVKGFGAGGVRALVAGGAVGEAAFSGVGGDGVDVGVGGCVGGDGWKRRGSGCEAVQGRRVGHLVFGSA